MVVNSDSAGKGTNCCFLLCVSLYCLKYHRATALGECLTCSQALAASQSLPTGWRRSGQTSPAPAPRSLCPAEPAATCDGSPHCLQDQGLQPRSCTERRPSHSHPLFFFPPFPPSYSGPFVGWQGGERGLARGEVGLTGILPHPPSCSKRLGLCVCPGGIESPGLALPTRNPDGGKASHLPQCEPLTHSSSDKSPMSIWGCFSSFMAHVITCGMWWE